jgi:DNA-3-methyladenine glycosylase I
LKKKVNFKIAFDNYDYLKIENDSDEKIEELKLDARIIQNKLKFFATISTAQKFMEEQKEFGPFSKYIWTFTNGKLIHNQPKSLKNVPATTEISDALAKDLKKRGFKFLGTTVVYAYMQATGIVNDHVMDCHCRKI